jgi:hypothetical protein
MWFFPDRGLDAATPIERYWFARLLFDALSWCDYLDDLDSPYARMQEERTRPVLYYSWNDQNWQTIPFFQHLNYEQRIECWTKLFISLIREDMDYPFCNVIDSSFYAIFQILINIIGDEIPLDRDRLCWEGEEVTDYHARARKLLFDFYQNTVAKDNPVSMPLECFPLNLHEIRKLVKEAGRRDDPFFNWVFLPGIDRKKSRQALATIVKLIEEGYPINEKTKEQLMSKYLPFPLDKSDLNLFKWVNLVDYLTDLFLEDKDFFFDEEECIDEDNGEVIRFYDTDMVLVENGEFIPNFHLGTMTYSLEYSFCLPLLTKYLTWVLTHPTQKKLPPHSYFVASVMDIPPQETFSEQFQSQETKRNLKKLEELSIVSAYIFNKI